MENSIGNDALAQHLRGCKSDVILTAENRDGELVVTAIVSGIYDLVEFLKRDSQCQFTTLVDITAVDYPGRERRFDVVYHFLSMALNQRVRLKAAVHEGSPVFSIINIHPSANWFEREVFDMYGIQFSGHPDLRRILTDYGFTGHPLRKDFPTTGFAEVRYDEEQKRVVYEPVSLVQEYRRFDFMSPWEGAQHVPEENPREGKSNEPLRSD